MSELKCPETISTAFIRIHEDGPCRVCVMRDDRLLRLARLVAFARARRSHRGNWAGFFCSPLPRGLQARAAAMVVDTTPESATLQR